MNNKKIYLLFLCTFFVLPSATVLLAEAPAPMPADAAIPEMSAEDFLAWQQSMDREIDNFVKSLPEEQQQQFNQDVAELTQMMENMSEQELADFIQSIFAQDGGDITVEPTPEKPIVSEIVPAAPEPVVVEKALEGTEKALKIIDNIITRTERFLRTTQRIPELPGKIEQWVEKDKVREWRHDLTWETLKGRIEALDQKVTQLKERDPVTKNYRYINGLIKNEATYNNLTKLSDDLTAAEPRVEAPTMGLGKVNKESRTAIKAVLSSFAESIYTLELESALEKIIAEYEPRAKQLKDEEEAARKKAVEESKKGLKESPRKVISGKRMDGGYSGPADAGDYGYPYAPSYAPGGYDGGYGRPEYDRERESAQTKTDATAASKDATGKKEDEKEKDKAAKKSDEFKKATEFIENALNIIDDLLVDTATDTMKKYIQQVPNNTDDYYKTQAATIKSAASALRRAKRKVGSMANKQEQAEIKKRVESEKEFSNIENEMRSRSVDENSNEALQELKMLSDAISALKYEDFTSSPIRRTPGNTAAQQAAEAKAAEEKALADAKAQADAVAAEQARAAEEKKQAEEAKAAAEKVAAEAKAQADARAAAQEQRVSEIEQKLRMLEGRE